MPQTAGPTATKVLIVEDQDMTARRLARIVTHAPELDVAAVTSTVETALVALDQHRPGIALVDLALPDGSGLDVIAAAAKADWPCDPIVISIFGDESRVVSAIQAGAKGYLHKGESEASILRSLQSLREGGSPISPQIARHLLGMLASGRIGTADEEQPDHGLTYREIEVLRAVSHGFKRREIADQMGISPGTVGTHINNIYKKLDVNSSISAVNTAGRLGLL